MKILITVPAYNEALNIAPLIKNVFENVPQECETLVIDDNSPDGTAKIVEGLVPDYSGRLRLLNRPEKQRRLYPVLSVRRLLRKIPGFQELVKLR
jgi:dolichol-phosphate mannosyltransferase